ncbi:putative nucleic acid-binding Zn ribbon protein [Rhizobium skierniewicense]|uniref:Putative nucleic acid-binding Zn ribbon protein n=1 Tax=Rhizobium skierniewicense TaxID=984260 RepID=A0A7W6G0K1_9HYPH|nr:putative nucleic acid-binding Zn ribbon protein [Rhizobium skierniewicense]
MTEKEVFFTDGPRVGICVICNAEFENGDRPRQVCSEACKRERALRYGATYRQDNRDLRAKIHAMFGGRAPTQGELLALIKSRKGKP